MKKKTETAKANHISEQIIKDPFVHRREVQSAIIKKMLAAYDQPIKPEEVLEPEDKMNYLNFEQEENH